ncbi:MAG: hypothetical protein Q4C33_04250 [bacterium]|nr:hypothetical protein [bacterium]
MYFSKDEILELKSGEKYLVLNSTTINQKEYYKIRKLNEKMDELIGGPKYISALKINDHLVIEDNLEQSIITELKDIFESSH